MIKVPTWKFKSSNYMRSQSGKLRHAQGPTTVLLRVSSLALSLRGSIFGIINISSSSSNGIRKILHTCINQSILGSSSSRSSKSKA